MSFEFYGGILALKLLREEHQAPQAQSESVAEAIIRHQDLGRAATSLHLDFCCNLQLYLVRLAKSGHPPTLRRVDLSSIRSTGNYTLI